MLSSLFVENTRKRLCRLRVFFRREKTDFILFASLNCELCETGFL